MTDSQLVLSPRVWSQQIPLHTPNASPCTIMPPRPTFSEPSKDVQNTGFGGRLPTPIYGHFQQSIDSKMDIGESTSDSILQSQDEAHYEIYARRRRLPTPIDEDEPMDIPLSPPMTRRFALSNEGLYSMHSPSKRPLDLTTSPRSGRLSFSMGIRADCELCRNRVPGHSNHIFRT